MEIERKLRSRRHARHTYEDTIINHVSYIVNLNHKNCVFWEFVLLSSFLKMCSFSQDNSYAEDSDFDEHIMRHFAAAARRARYVNRRGRERSSDTGPSEFLLSVHTEGLPHDVQHMHTSPEEHQSSSFELSVGDSPNSGVLTGINAQRPSSMVQGHMNMDLNSVDDMDGLVKPRYMLELLFSIFSCSHLSVLGKKLICLPYVDTLDQCCLQSLWILIDSNLFLFISLMLLGQITVDPK